MFRVLVSAASAAALALGAAILPARADDHAAGPGFEVWTGAALAPRNWSAYAGTTVNPFGSITADGWRIRVVAGAGSYEYARAETNGAATAYDVGFAFADAMLGYHHQFGTLTVKVFTGASWIDQVIRPPDPEFDDDGKLGIKGALETWWNVSSRMFVKSDITHAHYESDKRSFHETTLRGALGLRLDDTTQFGPELGVSIRPELTTREIGAFVRLDWGSTALSLSSGYQNGPSVADSDGLYVRGSLLYRY